LKPHLFDGVATRGQQLVRSARITPDLTATDIGADTEKAIDFARHSVNIMVYAAPNDVVARVISACVVVFAHDTFAKVLSALAGHTDAGNAIEGAVRSVEHWSTHTLRSAIDIVTPAILEGAFVVVVTPN
jgi:hypothetical protein